MCALGIAVPSRYAPQYTATSPPHIITPRRNCCGMNMETSHTVGKRRKIPTKAMVAANTMYAGIRAVGSRRSLNTQETAIKQVADLAAVEKT